MQSNQWVLLFVVVVNGRLSVCLSSLGGDQHLNMSSALSSVELSEFLSAPYEILFPRQRWTC